MPRRGAPLLVRGLVSGTAGEFYTLTDALTGVYVSPLFKNVLWAKDDNRYLNKSVPTGDQIASHHLYDAYDATQGVTEMDQSNWVKIVFPRTPRRTSPRWTRATG